MNPTPEFFSTSIVEFAAFGNHLYLISCWLDIDTKRRFEHESVRNHRIMLRVGILRDVEVLLGAHRRAELLERVVIIRGDCSDGCMPQRSSGKTQRDPGAAGVLSDSNGPAQA